MKDPVKYKVIKVVSALNVTLQYEIYMFNYK